MWSVTVFLEVKPLWMGRRQGPMSRQLWLCKTPLSRSSTQRTKIRWKRSPTIWMLTQSRKSETSSTSMWVITITSPSSKKPKLNKTSERCKSWQSSWQRWSITQSSPILLSSIQILSFKRKKHPLSLYRPWSVQLCECAIAIALERATPALPLEQVTPNPAKMALALGTSNRCRCHLKIKWLSMQL